MAAEVVDVADLTRPLQLLRWQVLAEHLAFILQAAAVQLVLTAAVLLLVVLVAQVPRAILQRVDLAEVAVAASDKILVWVVPVVPVAVAVQSLSRSNHRYFQRLLDNSWLHPSLPPISKYWAQYKLLHITAMAAI